MSLTIPPLGLGTGSAGNLYRAYSDDEVAAAFQAAWDSGIRYFDTAPHYGLGLAELRLGEFLRDKPRDDYVLSTKVGRLLVANPDYRGGDDSAHGFAVPDDQIRVFDPSEAGIRASLESSLARLGVDRIDILLLHDPEVYDLVRGVSEGIPALERIREEGLVSAIGIGTNSVDAAVRAVQAGDLDVVMIANRYTLLEQPALDELLPLCERRGIRVIDAAVFNSGLLATASPSEHGRYDYGAAPADILARAQRLADACARFGIELPAAALQFPLRHPAVASVVVSASRAQHVRQNVASASAPIPDALWEHLRTEGLIPA